MKNKWIVRLGTVAVVLMAVALVGGNVFGAMGGSAAFVAKYEDHGTVTLKFTMDADSATSIGTDHRSADAVKTPFHSVPCGIPFWIWIEHRDADSCKAFGPDTVHIGLETAPRGSYAVDSASSVQRYEAACQLWDFGSTFWAAFRQQTFFDVNRVDTLNDTVGVAATSLKSGTANKATTPLVNLGQLRFSLCLDDADSTTDSGIRLNVFIVYRDPMLVRTWGSATADDTETMYGRAESDAVYEDMMAWGEAPKAWIPRERRRF